MSKDIPGWTTPKKDRLEFDPGAETIDEVVMFGANVHLEQLSEHSFMLIMENDKRMWHLSIGSRSGWGKVDARLQEQTIKYKKAEKDDT